jgi:hypothetical protein
MNGRSCPSEIIDITLAAISGENEFSLTVKIPYL